jgi:hypothetical protein
MGFPLTENPFPRWKDFFKGFIKKPVVKPFKGFWKPKRYSIYIVCTHRLVHILRCVAYCFDFRNYNLIFLKSNSGSQL